MISDKCKKVRIGCLQQNVYLREPAVAALEDLAVSPKEYFSSNFKQDDTGYHYQIEKEKYPITPESLNSYADGCDYRKDPVGCQVPAGKNLGDIREMQNVLNMDSEQLSIFLTELQKKLNANKPVANEPVANEPVANEPVVKGDQKNG